MDERTRIKNEILENFGEDCPKCYNTGFYYSAFTYKLERCVFCYPLSASKYTLSCLLDKLIRACTDTSSLDFETLSKKLDEVLGNETPATLTTFLNEKRGTYYPCMWKDSNGE